MFPSPFEDTDKFVEKVRNALNSSGNVKNLS